MTKNKKVGLIIVLMVVVIGGFISYFFFQGQFLKKPNIQLIEEKIQEDLDASGKTEPIGNNYSLAIKIGTSQITIGDQEKTINLFGLLGEPISEKTEVSGPEAFP